MTYGFAESTFETITIPETEHLLIDDCTLAFFLGFRNKTLWHLIQNKENQYKVFHIPKSNGKKRVIHAPSPLMKVALHNLHARLLLPMQERLGDHVTAYRPQRSIVDAVNRHIPPCDVCDNAPKGKTPKKHNCPKNGVYIKMDLKDFFPSTRRSWIRRLFQDEGYSFYVSGLLANLMTVSFVNPKGFVGEQYKGTPRQKLFYGVPQGSPTSGAICNLVANHRFDSAILQYFDEKNKAASLEPPWDWRYSRYADDLTITCGVDIPVSEKKQVVKDVTQLVERSKYSINRSKTKITSAYYRRKMLGMVVNQKPNIEYEDYLRIRAMVHNCMVNGVETQNERAGKATPDDLIQFLRGKVSFIRQVHPNKGDKLKAELDVAINNWKEKDEH